MAKKKHVPEPPDDGIIYLYIENAVGIGMGADLRKTMDPNPYLISQWLHFMAEHLKISLNSVWSKPKTMAIILPVSVSGRDESQIQHLLGKHFWSDFLRPMRNPAVKAIYPQDKFPGLHSTVFICKLQNSGDIAVHEFFEVELLKPDRVSWRHIFLRNAYPAVHLPEADVPGNAYRVALLARPRPTTPPRTDDDDDKEEKKALFKQDGEDKFVEIQRELHILQASGGLEQREQEYNARISGGDSRSPASRPTAQPSSFSKHEEIEREIALADQKGHLKVLETMSASVKLEPEDQKPFLPKPEPVTEERTSSTTSAQTGPPETSRLLADSTIPKMESEEGQKEFRQAIQMLRRHQQTSHTISAVQSVGGSSFPKLEVMEHRGGTVRAQFYTPMVKQEGVKEWAQHPAKRSNRSGPEVDTNKRIKKE